MPSVSRNFIKTRPRERDWGMVGGRVAREGDRVGVGWWEGLEQWDRVVGRVVVGLDNGGIWLRRMWTIIHESIVELVN